MVPASEELRERRLRERTKALEALLAQGTITQQQFEAMRKEVPEVERVPCPSCGAFNFPAVRFCSNCGTGLGAQTMASHGLESKPAQAMEPEAQIAQPRDIARYLATFLSITGLSILVPPIGYLAGIALLIVGIASAISTVIPPLYLKLAIGITGIGLILIFIFALAPGGPTQAPMTPTPVPTTELAHGPTPAPYPEPTPVLSAEPQWTSFANVRHGYRILRPADWTLTSSRPAEAEVSTLASPDSMALVTIFSHLTQGQYHTLDSFTELSLKQLAGQAQVRVISRSAITLPNGIRANKVEFEWATEGRLRRAKMLVAIAGTRSFTVTASTWSEYWETYSGIFDQILESFAITELR